jgi:CRISPR-associated protein Csd2
MSWYVDQVCSNAPAHALFERIKVQRRPHVEVPRNFTDYEVIVDKEKLPQGITLVEY